MLNGADPALQIQVATMLRHFAGRESEAVCVQALETLLGSSDEDVRATAVLTLGDFGQSATRLRGRLTEMAGKDSSGNVREAATVTLGRMPAAAR
jgi:HEAT repeat protein